MTQHRVVWFVAGAGAGVYAVARARRAVEWLTPEGLADRLAGLSLGLHLFGEEVRAGMAERETELRGRLALTPHGGAPQLTVSNQTVTSESGTTGTGTNGTGTTGTGTTGTGTTGTGTNEKGHH